MQASKVKKVHPNFMQWVFFLIGLLIMSLGIVLMIRANLGSAPWDVLHIGLYNQFGLTIGTWSIIIGFFILGTSSILSKSLPQLGAFLNMLLVGIFIDLYLLVPFLVTPPTFIGKLLLLLVGIIVMGYGMCFYIAANCGAGPRDSLMLVLTQLTGFKIQWIRLGMEIIVLFLGWLLKGPIFIGTIIFCLSIGYVIGFSLPQCRYIVNRMLAYHEEKKESHIVDTNT